MSGRLTKGTVYVDPTGDFRFGSRACVAERGQGPDGLVKSRRLWRAELLRPKLKTPPMGPIDHD